MGYRLVMLGPPTLLRDGDPVPLKSHKGQALLWYLASHPTTTFPREHLQGLLWDELPADRARRNFNTMLSRLRAELPMKCFHSSRGQLGWDFKSGMDVDAVSFLQTFEHGKSGPRTPAVPPPQSAEQKDALYRAVALWRGPFLEGFSCDSASYEEWLLGERQRWEWRMFAALGALMNAEKTDSRWSEVATLARRALDIDPLQEPFHRAVMEALWHEGSRSAALAQFQLCRDTLKKELGTEPDAATVALFERIKASSASPAPSPSLSPATSLRRSAEQDKAPTSGRIVSDFIRRTQTSMPPLIGRRREYTRITETLRGPASGGQNPIVLVRGEAGIGKTRLLSEIIKDIVADTVADARFGTVLVGGAYESLVDAPYATFVDALTPILPHVDWTSIALPQIWLQELGRLLPDVFTHRTDVNPPEPGDANNNRLRLFQAVSKFLRALPQPVLLGFDDLQWADRLTIDLMAYLLRQPRTQLQLAVLTTARAGEESDALRLTFSNLEREARLTRIELANLSEGDTVALAQALFPDHGPERVPRVYPQSLGHPLYTVELLSMLTEADDVDPADLPVPSTVQNVFFGRLERLGEKAIEIAEALALFRRGTSTDTLRLATQRSEAHIAAVTDRLIRAYIVSEDGNGILAFQHDVFRRAILERLAGPRLVHLHRRAYAALSSTFAPENSDTPGPTPEGTDRQLLADLVTHSVSGRMAEEALHRTQQAALAAEGLYAFPAAVEYLNQALACLDELPFTEERRRQRLDIELRIANMDTWSPPDKRDARLDELARRAQQYNFLSHIPRIHMAKADSLILQGRCSEAALLLDRLRPLTSPDPRFALALHAWQGAIAALVGDVRSALDHWHRVQMVIGQQVLKPGTSIYAGMAVCHASMGDFVQAEAALAAVEQEEDEQGYQSLTSKFLTAAATVAYLRGAWAEAEQFARQALHISQVAEDPANEALASLWLGAALLESSPENGKLAGPDAMEALTNALAASERAQTYTRRDFIHAFLALGHARNGFYDEANKNVGEGLVIAQRFGYKEGQALCIEIQGRIAHLRGEQPTARRHLQRASAEFDALSNVVGGNRCRARLAAFN